MPVRDGNSVNEEIKLKRKIMQILYENSAIIELLDCPDVDPEQPDTALYTCIFPYVRVPNTQEEVGTFIGVKINMISPYEINDRFASMRIFVVILCAFDKLNVPGQKGIRTEIIASEIESALNWNNDFGFQIRLQSVSEEMATHEYYGCIMTFETIRSNTLKNGRTWPKR